MKMAVMLGMVILLVIGGCSRKSPHPADQGSGVDPRSLPALAETARISVGMHESAVAKILGAPYAREPGFYGGYRLWYKLYDPRHSTVPSQFLVTTDRDGYVTFISRP